MEPEQAYRRYFPLILQHARRILGEGAGAQDVAQEAFLRFLGARIRGGEPGVVAWLYRTSANLAIDALRRRASPRETGWRPAPSVSGGGEAGLSLRRTLERLASDVPQEVLRAGVLSRADGLTQQELALVLDVSPRTVRRWLTAFDEAVQRLAQETLA
jgi:RNA polymerase sigma factor (sigma-70 family)